MMKQLLVMFMLLCSTAVFAQDVIVKKDGSTILAKVLEVNTDNIKYKKHPNLSGPTYTINKPEIMSINYENGEKDVFGLEDDKKSRTDDNKNQSSCYLEKKADINNDYQISLYNKLYYPTEELTKKKKIKNRL